MLATANELHASPKTPAVEPRDLLALAERTELVILKRFALGASEVADSYREGWATEIARCQELARENTKLFHDVRRLNQRLTDTLNALMLAKREVGNLRQELLDRARPHLDRLAEEAQREMVDHFV